MAGSHPSHSDSTSLVAVAVLAGGESRRLGRPKEFLEWEAEPLLARIVRRLAVLAPGDVVVAARPEQPLPETGARRVADRRPGAGPLAGLSAALGDVERRHGPDAVVAVSACDHPFAEPLLFRALADRLGDADVAVPRFGGRLHVLQAIWRAGVGAECERALQAGERRVRVVLDRVRARVVDPHELPERIDLARALLNVNDSDDLARARRFLRSAARRPRSSSPGR